MKNKEIESLIKGDICIPESRDKNKDVLSTVIEGKANLLIGDIENDVNPLFSDPITIVKAEIEYLEKIKKANEELRFIIVDNSNKISSKESCGNVNVIDDINKLIASVEDLISMIDKYLEQLKNNLKQQNNNENI